MHPPHSAVFCNRKKALRARENTSHERPTFEQATLGAHKPKGQSTHGTHDHVPKHKKVSAHRSTRTAHRDTARPVFQPNKGTRSDTRASAYSHTLVSHTLVGPSPTPCPTQHVLDRTNYDAVLLHTPQRNTRSTTTPVPPGTPSLKAPPTVDMPHTQLQERPFLNTHTCASLRQSTHRLHNRGGAQSTHALCERGGAAKSSRCVYTRAWEAQPTTVLLAHGGEEAILHRQAHSPLNVSPETTNITHAVNTRGGDGSTPPIERHLAHTTLSHTHAMYAKAQQR